MQNSDRLFVGLWPDQDVLKDVVQVQTDFGLSEIGRCTQAAKIHLTLFFIGDVHPKQTREIKQLISEFSFPPLTIDLDVVGSWPRSAVAWIGCSEPSIELNELAFQVTKKLSGYRKDRRKFVPHVTLARKVRRKIHHEISPIQWTVDQVSLIRSTLHCGGAVYETISEANLKISS